MRRLHGRSPRTWLPHGSVLLATLLLSTSCGGGSAPELEAAVEVAVPEQAEASLGFSVDADSWKFRNYRADDETAFSVADAIALFGDDAVCVEASGGCTPTPAAAEWIAMVAHSMSFGSCEGMTVTSLDRFLVGAQPDSGQLPFSPDVARQVSRLFATQYLQEVIDATDRWRNESVATIVTELEAALADKSHEQYTLGVYTKGGGHSVLPYAVDRLEDSRAVIHVYDPNWPSQDRYIEVDTNSNIWRFSYSGKDPATDPEAWTGGSKKMDLQPLSSREAPHQEPFAGAGAGNRVLLAVTSTDRNWSLTAGDTTTEGAELIPGEDAVVAVIRAGSFGATTALIEVAAEDSDDIKFEAAEEATVTAQTPSGTTTVAARKQVTVQIRVEEAKLDVVVSEDADAVVSVATDSERIFVESADQLDTEVQVTEVETVVEFVDDAGEVVEEVVIESGEERVDIEVVVEETIVEVVDEQGEVVETVVIEAEAEVSEPEVFEAEIREEELVIAATAATTTQPPETTTSTSTTSTTEPPGTTSTSTTSTTEPPETSTTLIAPILAAVPAAITDLVVTAGTGEATGTFTVPADDGGSEITGYTVEYSTDAGVTWIIATSGEFTVSAPGPTVTLYSDDLTAWTTYSVRVSAVNAAGTGPTSNVATFTATATLPDAPTSLQAVSGDSELTLSWVTASDGGSDISDYLVEASTDGGSTWTTVTDFTILSSGATVAGTANNLVNGTTYQLRASAINAEGTGPASNIATAVPSAGASPETVPDAPTSLDVVPGTLEALMTWTAPVNIGGSTIADYVIEYSTDAGTTWTTFEDAVSAQTSFTFSSETLITGGPYELRVFAVNAIGAGPPSQTSTMPTVPATITDATVTAVGDQSVTATFTVPDNGGSAITGYIFEYSTDGGTTWLVDEDAFTLTFSGSTGTYYTAEVTNGTTYSGRVSATNAVGTSSASNAVAFTPAGVPATITDATVTAVGDQSVTATFTVPDNGGSAITGYIFEYSTDGGTTWLVDEDVFTLTFSGSTGTYYTAEVTNGTTYSGRVSATNALGTSSVSNVVTFTPVTVPGVPTGLIPSLDGSTGVSLLWAAPGVTGGSAITDYLVEYSSDSGSTWATYPDGTSTTLTAIVTGLGKGTNYTFRVSAVNAAGTGTASVTAQAAIPTTVPGAPTNLTAAATSGVDYSIDLAWTAPSDDGGSSLTDYIIEWQFVGDTEWWTVGPVDLTRDSMTDTSVTVGYLYSGGFVHVFRVTAINAVDEDGGDPSSTAEATPTPLSGW